MQPREEGAPLLCLVQEGLWGDVQRIRTEAGEEGESALGVAGRPVEGVTI